MDSWFSQLRFSADKLAAPSRTHKAVENAAMGRETQSAENIFRDRQAIGWCSCGVRRAGTVPPLLTGRRLEHGIRALLRNTLETRSLTCGSFGGRRVQLSEGKLGLRRCPSPARHLSIAFHSGVETHHPSSCRIFDGGRLQLWGEKLGLRPPAVDPQNSRKMHSTLETLSRCPLCSHRFFDGGRLQLWEEKLGLRPPFAGNAATAWGTRQEEHALARCDLAQPAIRHVSGAFAGMFWT